MEEHHKDVGSCSQVASCTINNSGFFLLISTWKILQNICQIYLVEVAKMAINRPIFVEIDIIKNKTCSKDSYYILKKPIYTVPEANILQPKRSFIQR